MLSGLNHVTLSVSDLDRSLAFYRDVLGCRPVARWDRGAYLLAGDVWLALVVGEDYSHVAFSVDDFETARERLRGVPQWQENTSEGDSLYFLDPDGHKLEVHVGDIHSRLEAAWPGLTRL